MKSKNESSKGEYHAIDSLANDMFWYALVRIQDIEECNKQDSNTQFSGHKPIVGDMYICCLLRQHPTQVSLKLREVAHQNISGRKKWKERKPIDRKCVLVRLARHGKFDHNHLLVPFYVHPLQGLQFLQSTRSSQGLSKHPILTQFRKLCHATYRGATQI